MAGLNSGIRGGIRSSQFRKRYIAMVRHRKPLSQTWQTFLDNHVGCLVSTDFFVVPTATFAVLFVFIVLRHERRRIEHFGVTAHPATAWVTVDPKSTSSPLVNAESVAQGDDLPLHGSPGPKPGRD